MRAITVLAFVLISSTSFAATSERYGKGGWYKDFQPEIERANASGELFRIKGHCQSNCTLFLGLRNVCVERCHSRGSTNRPAFQCPAGSSPWHRALFGQF